MTGHWQQLAADACHESADLARFMAGIYHGAGWHDHELDATAKARALDHLADELRAESLAA